MNKEVTISARNINIGYTRLGKKEFLYKDLSFDLVKGELVCLLGANGAGKSTLLRTLTKMQPLLGGEIKIVGKNIDDYDDKDLSQLIGLVLTDKSISGGFTVEEIVGLGRYPYSGFFGQLNDDDLKIIEKALKSVGIYAKAKFYMADLSDGERQKTMIAKALCQECPIIILDEPTAFLDVESKMEIMMLLHKLAHTKEKTILISTHDIDLAFLLSDKLWLLSRHNGLVNGVTEDIILSGTIDNFYLNKNIAFNKYSGSFYPIRSNPRKLYVNAKDELLFWTINLLLRLDLDYTTNESEAICTLNIKSINSIEIKEDHKTTTMNSFGELATYLKSTIINNK